MSEVRLKLRPEISPEQFVSHLVEAVSRLFLKHGFEGSEDALKEELCAAFHEAIEKTALPNRDDPNCEDTREDDGGEKKK